MQPLSQSISSYKEQFKDDLSIKRKVTQSHEKQSFHIHDQFELLLILSDGMQCTVGSKTYFLSKNTLLLFNDMDLHHISMTHPGVSDRYVVYFKPEYVSSLSTAQTDLLECFFFRPFADPHILCLTTAQTEQLLCLLDRIQPSHSSYGQDLRTKLCLGELLLFVNTLYREKHAIQEGSGALHYNTIYSIMTYLHRNYDSDLSLDFLSSEFYINKYSLCNLFKKVTGTSVNQYLIHCRLMKAKELLLARESVEAVCARVGYHNLSHFSRIFKQHTGQSPKQYQMAHLHEER